MPVNLFKRFIASLGLVGLELLVLAAVALACVIVFVVMAKTVFIDQNHAFDHAAFAFARNHSSPGFTRFMTIVTFFASRDFLIFGSLGLALIFMFFKKHRWYSLKIPVVAGGGTLLNRGLKALFDRPRPETAFFYQPGDSFPSGHAMIGGAFYGLLIYLVWTNVRSAGLRWFLVALLALLVLLIGYSRIYLNVHYASDVLAGWSAGLLFLFTSLYLLRKLEPRYAVEASEIMGEEVTDIREENGEPDTPAAKP